MIHGTDLSPLPICLFQRTEKYAVHGFWGKSDSSELSWGSAVHILCPGYIPHCCDKTFSQKLLEGEPIYSAHSPRV